MYCLYCTVLYCTILYCTVLYCLDLNPLGTGRAEHACSWLRNKKWDVVLVVAGGHNHLNGKDSHDVEVCTLSLEFLSSVEILTIEQGPRTDKWKPARPLPRGLSGLRAASLSYESHPDVAWMTRQKVFVTGHS